MDRVRKYSSDLNNEEWDIVSSLIPLAKSGGRRRSVNIRAVMNGIFYLVRTGCHTLMVLILVKSLYKTYTTKQNGQLFLSSVMSYTLSKCFPKDGL